jgi:hypothetical protein
MSAGINCAGRAYASMIAAECWTGGEGDWVELTGLLLGCMHVGHYREWKGRVDGELGWVNEDACMVGGWGRGVSISCFWHVVPTEVCMSCT